MGGERSINPNRRVLGAGNCHGEDQKTRRSQAQHHLLQAKRSTAKLLAPSSPTSGNRIGWFLRRYSYNITPGEYFSVLFGPGPPFIDLALRNRATLRNG
ncbi:hypothetical protein [Qipengyuania sp.]|uniref:hypothetical protein n=1 Tax=Qipengyuania sp. TaxID=2004515 RepID=UPI0035C7F172